MKSPLGSATVRYCYPSNKSGTIEQLVDQIVSLVRNNDEVGFAGFAEKKDLRQHLLLRYGESRTTIKSPILKPVLRKAVTSICKDTVKKCNTATSNSKATHIYVFPWLNGKYEKDFGGVTGFTPYKGVVHIFLSADKFDLASLRDTVGHEYNHSIFFRRHNSADTLLSAIIFEGLADNFVVDVLGSDVPVWSRSLTKDECRRTYLSLKRKLFSTDYQLYLDVFFGSKKYKKWSGYAIGYQIVANFRLNNPKYSWKQLLSMPTDTIACNPSL